MFVLFLMSLGVTVAEAMFAGRGGWLLFGCLTPIVLLGVLCVAGGLWYLFQRVSLEEPTSADSRLRFSRRELKRANDDGQAGRLDENVPWSEVTEVRAEPTSRSLLWKIVIDCGLHGPLRRDSETWGDERISVFVCGGDRNAKLVVELLSQFASAGRRASKSDLVEVVEPIRLMGYRSWLRAWFGGAPSKIVIGPTHVEFGDAALAALEDLAPASVHSFIRGRARGTLLQVMWVYRGKNGRHRPFRGISLLVVAAPGLTRTERKARCNEIRAAIETQRRQAILRAAAKPPA